MQNSDTPVTKVSQVSPDLIRKYIDGCHILHYYDLVDAYGNFSVRLSASTLRISRYMAPALVARPDDLVVYKVEDGEPVDPNAPRGMSYIFVMKSAGSLMRCRILGETHPFRDIQSLP